MRVGLLPHLPGHRAHAKRRLPRDLRRGARRDRNAREALADLGRDSGLLRRLAVGETIGGSTIVRRRTYAIHRPVGRLRPTQIACDAAELAFTGGARRATKAGDTRLTRSLLRRSSPSCTPPERVTTRSALNRDRPKLLVVGLRRLEDRPEPPAHLEPPDIIGRSAIDRRPPRTPLLPRLQVDRSLLHSSAPAQERCGSSGLRSVPATHM